MGMGTPAVAAAGRRMCCPLARDRGTEGETECTILSGALTRSPTAFKLVALVWLSCCGFCLTLLLLLLLLLVVVLLLPLLLLVLMVLMVVVVVVLLLAVVLLMVVVEKEDLVVLLSLLELVLVMCLSVFMTCPSDTATSISARYFCFDLTPFKTLWQLPMVLAAVVCAHVHECVCWQRKYR